MSSYSCWSLSFLSIAVRYRVSSSFCCRANRYAWSSQIICFIASIQELSSNVAEMDNRLATIDMGRKVGAAVSLSVGYLGTQLTQCRLGRCQPPYQVAFWSIQPFVHDTPTLRTDKSDSTTVPQHIGRNVTCNGHPINWNKKQNRKKSGRVNEDRSGIIAAATLGHAKLI